MSFEMKAFLLLFAFGASLRVAESKASATFPLNSLLYPSLFPQNADADHGTYKPCCTSETMEGTVQFIYLQTGTSNPIKFYVDHRNRKYAFKDELTTTKIIASCDSQSTCIVYNIIESQKLCLKNKVKNASIENAVMRCIPENATSLGMMRMGSDEKQSSLLIQRWMFKYQMVWVQRLVTDVDCTPVIDFMGMSPNMTYLQQFYYYDITKRIKDPSVFIPPSYCVTANDMQADSSFQQRKFTSLLSMFK